MPNSHSAKRLLEMSIKEGCFRVWIGTGRGNDILDASGLYPNCSSPLDIDDIHFALLHGIAAPHDCGLLLGLKQALHLQSQLPQALCVFSSCSNNRTSMTFQSHTLFEI